MFQNESLVREFKNSLDAFNQGNTDLFPFFHNLLNCGWKLQQIFDAYQEFAQINTTTDNFCNYAESVMNQFEKQGFIVQ